MVEKILTFGARHRIISVLLLAILSFIGMTGAERLQIDTSYDSLMSGSDPQRDAYHQTVQTFGSDNTTIIYFRDPDLFTRDKLHKIENLTLALSELKAVERVESVFSVIHVRNMDGAIEIKPLLEVAPRTDAEAKAALAAALTNPLLVGNLVSPDGTVIAVNVTIQRDFEDKRFNTEFTHTIESMIHPLRGAFQEIFQVGPPRVNSEIQRAMFHDLQTVTPLAVAVLITVIIISLQNVTAAVIPLVTAGLTILWTLGFMGFMGYPLTLLTCIVPSLVIVIGSNEDTHMIASYLSGVHAEKGDRMKAIEFMAKTVGLPIFITTLTTVLGFAANAYYDIILIRQFAIVSTFAMSSNLIATLLALPAILRIHGPRKSRVVDSIEGEPRGFFAWIIRLCWAVTSRHRRAVTVSVILFAIAMGYYSFKVQVNNDPLSYFRKDSALVKQSQILHRDLSGMQIFYITLEGALPGTFCEAPNVLAIEKVQKYLNGLGLFDKTISIADHISFVHREMNDGKPSFYMVPSEEGSIWQYVMLFQRSDLAPYISADHRQANIIVRHNISSSLDLNRVTRLLNKDIPPMLGDGISFRVTGENLLINSAAESLFVDQVQSLFVLIAVIFVIMALLFTSTRAGLISLIPNTIPAFATFGIMGFLGIPLNPGTATVAMIALGIAVDNTVHFMSAFNHKMRECGVETEAQYKTLQHETLPVISSSLALAGGFLIYLTSDFSILVEFGLLSATTMFIAMIGDLLVTPMLLTKIRVIGIWEIVAIQPGPEVLTKSPLFRDMSPFQIKKAILLTRIVDIPQDTVIFEQGKLEAAMYLVLKGKVSVVRRDSNGESHTLAELGPGEVFGEVGFTHEYERTATCKTLAPCQLLRFDYESLNKALGSHPKISAKMNLNISRILAHRLASTYKRIA